MTKQELYEALHAAGVKLPEYRRITQAALEELYNAILQTQTEDPPAAAPAAAPEKTEPPQPQEKPPALFFDHAGWCDALGRSYFMGYYWPQSWAEYKALLPFAKGGAQ